MLICVNPAIQVPYGTMHLFPGERLCVAARWGEAETWRRRLGPRFDDFDGVDFNLH